MAAALQHLVQCRGQVKAHLTRFRAFLQEYTPDQGTIAIETRLQKIEPLFEKFDGLQSQIEDAAEEQDLPAVEAERDQFETVYFELVTRARTFIQRDTEAGNRNANNRRSADDRNEPGGGFNEQPSCVKLPVMKVPTFDGSQERWIKFRDMFQSMIDDNPTLTDIQKFHYLDSAITGDAARSIEALGISATNYATAWRTLKERFEDSKALSHYHVRGLFELPMMVKDSHASLRQLIDKTNNHMQSLQNLGEPVEGWDSMIVYVISTKLDAYTKREWDKKALQSAEKPKFKEIIDFLNSHCKFLERTVSNKQDSVSKGSTTSSLGSKPSRNFQKSKLDHVSANVVAQNVSCSLCKGSHHIYHCEEFVKLPIQARITEAQKHRLCFNCLRSDHQNKDCKSGNCRKCSRKHNTLLHRDESSEETKPKPNASTNVSANVSMRSDEDVNANLACNHAQRRESQVILATAIVGIQDSTGTRRDCRVLLDGGSQSHFVTQDLCKRLGLKLVEINQPVSGLGQQQTNLSYKTQVDIRSKHNAYGAKITCLVIRNITDDMPNVSLDWANLKIPANLVLADPQFYDSRPIDMLIGAELFWSLLCVGQIPLGPRYPIMQQTKLGWVLGGPMGTSTEEKHRSRRTTCHLITTQQLHDQVARFWELEECSNPQTLKGKPEDTIREDYYRETTMRNEEGRFVVSIPFRENLQNLGHSRSQAHRRLLAMEKKLKGNPSLSNEYSMFMQDYEDAGHMAKISDERSEVEETGYYLPHHAVTKEGSTTTKVRVVFDGSAKSSSGLSINDAQYVGPVVQDDLFSILLRFRKHRFGFSADIKQMYRQILIQPDQRKFQRILWRENESSTIVDYELNTITYGMASAPFLATRSLLQVAKENLDDYPTASQVIERDFYMDDLLSGASSISEAQRLKREVSELLKQYGFDLRKWARNDERVVFSNDDEPRHLPLHDTKDPKTLGLLWMPDTDMLSFSFGIPALGQVTKRTILSAIARIFDPLGLIAPIVVSAKMILQRVWQLNLGWDEALPQELHTAWEQFHRQLDTLDQIRVTRNAFGQVGEEVQLHGFSDASEKAYGACVYIRVAGETGPAKVSLLCAKSRVAPLKTVTLPRLELCAAVLLARLMQRVSSSLGIDKEHQVFWSDSTIVLCYIASEPGRWTTFVANRTAEIQNLTNQNWRHVPTADNPADLTSRGTDNARLRESSLWWHGPSWLTQRDSSWPKLKGVVPRTLPDSKSKPITTLTIVNISSELGTKFSSITRLIRVVSYCLQFVSNVRQPKGSRETGSLTVRELVATETLLLRLAQQQDFPSEIASLKNKCEVSKRSPISSLLPFIDDKGCLRVGGRIRHARIPFEQKHPIIVSHRNPLAQRLVEHEHIQGLHAGPQFVLASLRTRYWITSGKSYVKRILRNCVRYFRTKPTPLSYRMGDLPESRITPSRPFYVTGVDYAGPFFIREKSRSKTIIKSYLCVFVCFATKAVHFELATDMSTKAFLNCLRRFIARRGKCKSIYSDNGTNFVGAANEFAELRQLLKERSHNDQVREFLSLDHITWYNIPPYAPNFGGLWESAVRSAKYHLKRVLTDLPLTFEDMYTVLTQVEAILNSRPLSPLSDDPQDLIPLTPAHFLIGDSLTALPHHDLQDVTSNRLTKYERLQQLIQHFWRRWNIEYLHQLQTRYKGKSQPKIPIKPGMMVVLCDDNTVPMHWNLGRIETIHPGRDEIVRVVSVKTAGGTYKRPLSKIRLLPISEPNGSDKSV